MGKRGGGVVGVVGLGWYYIIVIVCRMGVGVVLTALVLRGSQSKSIDHITALSAALGCLSRPFPRRSFFNSADQYVRTLAFSSVNSYELEHPLPIIPKLTFLPMMLWNCLIIRIEELMRSERASRSSLLNFLSVPSIILCS